jgi:hypothetical protein
MASATREAGQVTYRDPDSGLEFASGEDYERERRAHERTIDPRILELPEVGPAGSDPMLDGPREREGRPAKVDRLGNPLTLREWMRAFEHTVDGGWRGSYRDVAWDEGGTNEAGGPAWSVWTSWSGLTSSVPRVFETLVFRELGERPGERYELLESHGADTEEEALRVHRESVERAPELAC